MGQQNYQRNCKAVREKQPPERKPQTDEYLSIHLPPRFLLTFLSIYFSTSSFIPSPPTFFFSLQESELSTKVYKIYS